MRTSRDESGKLCFGPEELMANSQAVLSRDLQQRNVNKKTPGKILFEES